MADYMKIIFCILFLSLMMPVLSAAQDKRLETESNESVRSKPEPILFESLENPNCELHMAVMDRYFVELQNDPSATGYVVTYANVRQTAKSERQMRSYLKVRKFPLERLVFLQGGGTSAKPTIEFWVVPAGAAPPEIDPPVLENVFVIEESPSDPTGPYIFSSEYYDGVACYGETQEIDLEGYAEILKEYPKSRGNIVIITLTRKEFRKKANEILNFLLKKGIARKRLRTFHQKSFGGVELWFLP